MWGTTEINEWQNKQEKKRSYRVDVISGLEHLSEKFKKKEYGIVSYEDEQYPLYLFSSKNIDKSKSSILVTGGVHGYETSGVRGALDFLAEISDEYLNEFNFIVAPCVSPWAYETINRWNYNAIDPNRSFYENSPAEECRLLMDAVKSFDLKFLAHFDLHETTDTDNTVFRPALEARDGVKQEVWDIPDGFYVVGDSEKPCHEFQNAVIDSVRKVTHIAPSDKQGKIIGEDTTGEGIINYPVKKLFLCTGFSDAEYTTTTEVYPDSPKTNPEECAKAQVAAIFGGLDYLRGIKSC
ncbi:M14 family metallocarboxypeptidase [Bacteriovorax sp. Seq25_V]|uniref:M14 family metallopeptidase n=1 Tax=Bacteriovorax sp. Seq25_V TaxID=1201288 RepID=UPI00038A19C8|nr:M14 family metallocarboxypeptidase [Bacteriovorax sp. Seq25_V]EQC47589.1 zinc carboxypeptidase domain protein [Bacteriovorax sp. Seq25_V]